jgi:hypothetical protein
MPTSLARAGPGKQQATFSSSIMCLCLCLT